MSEQTIARLTKSLHMDRRFRQARHSGERCPQCHGPVHPRIYGSPAKTNAESVSLKEFGFALVVCLLIGVAFWLWAGILAAGAA